MLLADDYISLETPLLMSKDYYGFDKTEATRIRSRTSQITGFPSMVMTIAGGYIFDIFGRQLPLFILILVSGFIFILYPLGAPSSTMFVFSASLYSLIVTPVTNHPLIQDYVVKSSRGTANSFAMMGLSLGVISCLSVLFQFTKNLDPTVSWGIMSIIQILFSISILYIVKDPPVITNRTSDEPKL